jgi:O-antigen ligase
MMRTMLRMSESLFFFLLIFFLPTQLGKHFWPDFSSLLGVRVDYLSPTLYMTDVLIILLFLVWSPRFFSKRQTVNRSFILFSFFCFYLLLTILLSSHLWNGLYHFIKFLEFSFVAYYVSRGVTRISQVLTLLCVEAIGVMSESLLAFAQFVHQGSLGGLFYFFGERFFTGMTPGIANANINGTLVLRPYGTFSHPNTFAAYVFLFLLFVLLLLPFVKKKYEQYVFRLCLLLGTAGLVLSMSRFPVLLWFCVLLSIFIFHLRKTIRSKNFLLLVIGILFTGILTAFSPLGMRFLETTVVDESVTTRITMIQTAGSLFLQRPLFGVGLGNYLPSLSTLPLPFFNHLIYQPVHNIFLLILVETGIIGLSFSLWFLWKTYRYLYQSFKKSQENRRIWSVTCLLLLSVSLLLGMVDHYFLTQQQGQLLFAVIIGLCWVRLAK